MAVEERGLAEEGEDEERGGDEVDDGDVEATKEADVEGDGGAAQRGEQGVQAAS